MLYWIYVLITLFLSIIIIIELFSEKQWKKQIALAMVLLPFVLRILQIK
nr:hypothetical protein [candidate division Zixibacteria bacterium]